MEALRAEFLRHIWKLWGLRAMVVFTLAVQIVLILFGHKRKSSHSLKLRIAVWSAYLTADSLAIVAIGILSSTLREVYERNDGRLDDNDKLLAFWAPMLLLLLGGPDTITSYSLEDNELWLRHCLRLAVQTSATAYIIFMAWTSSYLSYLKSVIAFVGIVKYGERVCALWMASNDKLKQSILTTDELKQSMLAPPDPSPNYPRFPEYTLKKAEGYIVVVDKVIEIEEPEGISSTINDPEDIVKAYDLLQMFKCLFVEWTLSYGERNISSSIFKHIDSKDAFRIVEIELGFLYDLLYTKAMVLYTKWGLLLRSFTFSSTLLVLVLFSLAKKSHLSRSDLSITYLLLAFIVFFEAYSIFMLVCSDWSNVWLCKGNKCRALRHGLVCALNYIKSTGRPRWSHSMAQFSLLSFCTKERPSVYHNVLEFLRINETLEKYHYTLHEHVSHDFRVWIFDHIKKELTNVEEHLAPVPMDIHKYLTKLLNSHGLAQATWAVKGEFNQVVLTWHIVTEILYHSDSKQSKLPYSQMSKRLSRYMFYLLVMYPSMLPGVIREIRLHVTFADALKFFEDHLLPNNPKPYLQQASEMLLGERTEVQPSIWRDACWILAQMRETGGELRWEIISELWVKILMYAASQCRGDRHAGQLRRGGELLTHVWLMMAHFGLTDHFKMTQREVFVKVISR